MEICFSILQYLGVEAIRPPLFSPERNRDNFSKTIDLQARTAHCADDTSIVDNLDLDAQLHSPQIQIRMGGRTESIADNQKRIVSILVLILGYLL